MDPITLFLKSLGGLPPWVKGLMLILGIGSASALVFGVLKYVKAFTTTHWIIIGVVVGIALLIFGILFFLRRMRASKQSSTLEGALRSTSGPTAGDVAEQNRIYREKFVEKLGKLRDAGLSVYKLPWFVVIGEPGCGKTQSLLNSGINFPLGREAIEGFGGTRNYDWIFADDAVLLDTAGRLTFQEEGATDKAEWEIFLKLLRNNRPRCPINGIVVVIPANKLLTETADDRSRNASILRERLRQIQSGLGIRFPVFLLISKTDMIPGFTEFVEEIRPNLNERRQMVGWSRPGEFQSPFDPKEFFEAFDVLRLRLRQWSMKYLNRKATDRELGMIAAFPEALRDIRESLGEYVATIFQKSPLIEPPFFRGFYFSSSVQEGGTISRLFRHGAASQRQFEERKAQSMPFFLFDFYSKKVFPEQGLVFRSAKHASMNKKMRRMVFGGSIGIGSLAAIFFGVGLWNSATLIDKPRERAELAVKTLAVDDAPSQTIDDAKLRTNIESAKALEAQIIGYDKFQTRLFAKMLWIGANVATPRDSLRQIHARFVIDEIGRPLLSHVEKKLIEPVPSDSAKRVQQIAALRAYASWFGQSAGNKPDAALSATDAAQRSTEFADMLKLVDVLNPADADEVRKQFALAMETLASTQPIAAFPRDVFAGKNGFNRGGKVAQDVLTQGIARVGESWKTAAEVTAFDFQLWSELAARFESLRTRYAQLLETAKTFNESPDEASAKINKLTEGVDKLAEEKPDAQTGSILEAMVELRQFLKASGAKFPERGGKLLRFGELESLARKKWEDELATIGKSLAAGEDKVDESKGDRAVVYAAIGAARATLAKTLLDGTRKIRAQILGGDASTGAAPTTSGPAVDPVDEFLRSGLLREEPIAVGDARKGTLKIADDAFGKKNVVIEYLKDVRTRSNQGDLSAILADFATWDEALGGSDPAAAAGAVATGGLLDTWINEATKERKDPSPTKIVETSTLPEEAFWQPVRLFDLAQRVTVSYRQGRESRLLGQMAVVAEKSVSEARVPDSDGFLRYAGLGRLMKDYDAPTDMKFRWNQYSKPAGERAAAKPDQPEAKPEETRRRRGGGGGAESQPAETPTDPTAATLGGARGRDSVLTRYHTRDFLCNTLREHQRLRIVLTSPRFKDRSAELLAKVDAAASEYAVSYLKDWALLNQRGALSLDEAVLKLLDSLGKGELDWPQFADRLKQANVSRSVRERLTEMFQQAAVPQWPLSKDKDPIDDPIYTILERADDRVSNSVFSVFEKKIEDNKSADSIVNDVVGAWDEYAASVNELGELTDLLGPNVSLPDLAKLRKRIKDAHAGPSSATIAALLDIAEQGQVLLRHRVESRIAALLGDVSGKYPFVALESNEPATRLEKLSKTTVAEPDATLKLIREIALVRERFHPLWVASGKSSDDAPGGEPLDQTTFAASQWRRFLFEKPGDMTKDRKPDLVQVAIVFSSKAGEAEAAGGLYDFVTARLPLATESRVQIDSIKLDSAPGSSKKNLSTSDVAGAFGDKSAAETYRLDLFSGVDYGVLEFGVADRSPKALANLKESASTNESWKLPSGAWSLLMLVDAHENGLLAGFKSRWSIPIAIHVGGATPVGFSMGIQLGTEARPYPGPIPPLAAPASIPRMESATKYLKLN
ncbi:MAG: type VI secretion protein IcmF/TssM N-terminal domain-containing protein [Phycisphaerae bacterium]